MTSPPPQEIPSHGIVVIGPGGSGKSTFCKALSDLYTSIDRPHCIVNADPGNECLPYVPAIDVMDLVKTEDVQSALHLGFDNQP